MVGSALWDGQSDFSGSGGDDDWILVEGIGQYLNAEHFARPLRR